MVEDTIRKTLVRLLLIFSGVVASDVVVAGEYVGRVKPGWYSGVLYIDVTLATATNRPPCATRTLVRLAESDPNDVVFKSKYAILVSAWMSDRPVFVSGSGTCTSEGDEI